MRYEKAKSVILTFLVVASIFLTWNLWTYQPNFDMLQKGNTVAGVSVSEKQEVKKIIQPDEVLFHNKDNHFGTTNADEIDKMMKELEKWSFYDVKNYSDKVGNIKELTHGSGNTEIIFPGDVPIEIYRSVLKFEDKKIPSFHFNRIIINIDNPEKDNGIVYFVSSDYRQVYISHISVGNLSVFARDFYKNASRFPQYFPYEENDVRTIFIPEGATEMMQYKYLPITLNSEAFKDALFSDPSYVQKSLVTNGEEFSNGFSKMTVNYDINMLTYVNPTVDNRYGDTSYDLVKKSIDFVNEHGGWTDPYRFVSKSDINQAVTFRLYNPDGYPVFNERGTSEITEVWGKNEINKYIRPIISLELPLTSEMQKVTLPTGQAVLDYLESRKNFKPELLEKVFLGYRMDKDVDEQKLILLKPAWFYLYNKTWGEITTEDLGGM